MELYSNNTFFQAANQKTFREEKLKPQLERIQKILQRNNGGSGFMVGDGVSVNILYLHKMTIRKLCKQ